MRENKLEEQKGDDFPKVVWSKLGETHFGLKKCEESWWVKCPATALTSPWFSEVPPPPRKKCIL